VLAGLLGTTLLASGAQAQGVTDGTTNSGRSVDESEIIVTAAKREQTLLEVPTSVQVLSGESLRERGVETFVDLSRETPGVIVSNNLVGGSTVQTFTIRGIGFDDFRPNGNPAAAVHFDGVYQGSSALVSGQLFDVERIEVLKGPQGTLYGRNTTAGAINVISRKPSMYTEGVVNSEFSSFNSARLEAALNVPVNDAISVRISGLYDRTDGYLTNLGAPETAGTSPVPSVIPAITDPGVNDEVGRSKNVAARVLVSVGQGTSSELLFNVHGFQADGGQAQSEPIGTGLPLRSFVSNIDPKQEKDNWGASLTWERELGADMLLTVLGGYEWMESAFEWNDGAAIRVFDIEYSDKVEQGVAEARLQNRVSGDFNWTVGANYFRDRVQLDSVLDGSDRFLTVFDASYVQKRESVAAFGNIDFRLAPRLRADLGARITHDESDYTGATIDLDPYGLSVAGGIFELPAVFDNSLSGTSPSGRATLIYELSSDANVYAAVGRGYRSGGFDGSTIFSAVEAAAFEPETVWSYEGGLKFLPRGGPINIDIAAFYYDFTNIQANQALIFDGATTNVRTNVGKARSFGGEALLNMRPVDRLAMTFGVALLDTKVLEANSDSPEEAMRRLGNELPFAPPVTLNASVAYSLPLGNGLELRPRVDARYVGSYFGDLDNSAPVGDFTLLNLRVDLESDSGWSLAAFARNATNEVYTTGGSPVSRFSGPPREIGVAARFQF
jgi:iron complex outermembrane receptor protein